LEKLHANILAEIVDLVRAVRPVDRQRHGASISMNKYKPSTPRAAAGLTAVAMVAITMAALVVLPAKLESVGTDAFTMAGNAATKKPIDVTASPAGIDLPSATNRGAYVEHPDRTALGVQASQAKRDNLNSRRRAEI
jgi:hypothetical protein